MKSKALFIDRDGVVNVDHGYTHTIEKFEFMPGIFELLSLFQSLGYRLFIVTNQSGIGRGYYSLEAFEKLTSWMVQEFACRDIVITNVYFCPHAPTEKCQCRKPATGMIDQATSEYEIDLEGSWMIGDKQSDIDLAHNAGIGHSIAIGQREITNASLRFASVQECVEYLQVNQGKIAGIIT